jgi:hypothetical protein
MEVQLSVDTLVLVGLLEKNEIEYIHDCFSLEYNNRDFAFDYSLLANNFRVFTGLRNHFCRNKHYNSMIVIPKTPSAPLPSSLVEIINMTKWIPKRIDLAFDFSEETKKHCFLQRYGNSKLDDGDGEFEGGMYFGKLTNNRSKCKALLYDRNSKERDYKQSNIRYINSTRLEFRMNNDLKIHPSIHELNDDYIIKELGKYNFIQNVHELPVTKRDKNRLIKAMASAKEYEKQWAKFDKNEVRRIKKVLKENRVPLEDIYKEKRENLLSYLSNNGLEVGYVKVANL